MARADLSALGGQSFLFIWDEVHGNRVDAMSNILLCEAFARKDVAQVCTTIHAAYFCADSVGVRGSLHGAGYLVVEAGPSAVGFKLAFGAVEPWTAPFADIGASFPVIVEQAGERLLSTLENYDPLFFLGELFVFHFFLCHFSPSSQPHAPNLILKIGSCAQKILNLILKVVSRVQKVLELGFIDNVGQAKTAPNPSKQRYNKEGNNLSFHNDHSNLPYYQ
jgi:hypothetical protein